MKHMHWEVADTVEKYIQKTLTFINIDLLRCWWSYSFIFFFFFFFDSIFIKKKRFLLVFLFLFLFYMPIFNHLRNRNLYILCKQIDHDFIHIKAITGIECVWKEKKWPIWLHIEFTVCIFHGYYFYSCKTLNFY